MSCSVGVGAAAPAFFADEEFLDPPMVRSGAGQRIHRTTCRAPDQRWRQTGRLRSPALYSVPGS
jgi:hypothetical protein